jgi:hypothetical protein
MIFNFTDYDHGDQINEDEMRVVGSHMWKARKQIVLETSEWTETN